jgi:hypothetical protein
LGSPSSSDDKEFDDDGHDIHTIKGEPNVAIRALRDEYQEVEWLKVCLSAAEMALGAADRGGIGQGHECCCPC